MRHLLVSRDFREGCVDMLPASIGLIPFGMVCGVAAATAGADWLGALGMSAIIFSGAAQMLSAQLLAADAPIPVIVLTSFVLGLRFLMYSAAMAPYVKPMPAHWQKVIAFLLTDQSFAMMIRRYGASDDARAAGVYFLGAGAAMWGGWQLANMAGYFMGSAIPSAWSLEFAVPLCFVALIAPLFINGPMIVAVLVAGVAVMALAAMPMKLNLIVAGLLGIAAGTLADIVKEAWRSR